MGKLDGKVAFITGAARGQGRSHALEFAREGANLVLLDSCAALDTVQYVTATPEDLAETVSLVEAEGAGVVAIEGDVRNYDDVSKATTTAVERFGRLDLVLANAGILANTGEPSKTMKAWHDSIDTMLTGVFNTLRASIEPMVNGGNGGSIVITSSTSGLEGIAYDIDMLNPGEMGYTAAKHGVVGLMRNFARALGPHRIRVNCVHPMGVRTPMLSNDFFGSIIDNAPAGWLANAMGVDLVEPQDISKAMLWLCSDDSRYVTGTSIVVDAGQGLL